MAGAFVKVGHNTANGNTVTFTPTNNGDWLVIDTETSSGGGTPTASIADNHSSAYSTLIATTQYATGHWHTVFYLENCSTSITTITLTFSGGTPGTCNIGVAEYSGLATSSSVLAHTGLNVQTSPGTATDAITSGALNFSSVPGLLISASYDYSSTNGFVAGTGFTSDSTSYVGGAAGSVLEHQRLIATNASIPATYTSASHGTDNFFSWAAAVLEPGGGTAYTLTAAMGSFGLTGEAALRGLAITAAQGSFALTGNTVTFPRGRNISAEDGIFALTGNNATLTWNRSYIPSTLTLKGA